MSVKHTNSTSDSVCGSYSLRKDVACTESVAEADGRVGVGVGDVCSSGVVGDGVHEQKRGSQQLRRHNRSRLLQLLRQGELTRSELSVASGLTGAAVSRITRELLEANLLVEKKRFHKPAGAGRRSVTLGINPQGAFVIGVTITANRLAVAISNCAGEIVNHAQVRIANTLNPSDVLDQLVRATGDLLTQCDRHRCSKTHCPAGDTERASAQHTAKAGSGFNRNRLAGIGISMAVSSGDVIECTGSGQVFVSSRALGWTSVDVAGPFANRFQLPVEVEPRAVAILRSEANRIRCPDKQSTVHSAGGLSADPCGLTINSNVFLVNVGLGLGTATRVERNVYGCSSNRIGDLTHLAHPDSTQVCECGRQGCLQHVATGAAVVRDIAAAQRTRPQPDTGTQTETRHAAPYPQCVAHTSASAQPQATALSELNPALDNALALAKAGDAVARQALFDAGVRLAFGLDLVHALLDPDQMVLAGAVGRQQDYVAGVRYGLAGYRTPLQHQQLRVSEYTSSVAAVSIGLEAFVFSDRLDLSRFAHDKHEDSRHKVRQSQSDSIPEVV